MPNSSSIINWRSENVAEFDNVRLAVLPSEEVTRILLVLLGNGEGEGGDGFDVGLVSVADICVNQ